MGPVGYQQGLQGYVGKQNMTPCRAGLHNAIVFREQTLGFVPQLVLFCRPILGVIVVVVVVVVASFPFPFPFPSLCLRKSALEHEIKKTAGKYSFGDSVRSVCSQSPVAGDGGEWKEIRHYFGSVELGL